MRINLNPPADATAKNESTTFLMIRFAITYSVFLLIILLLMVHSTVSQQHALKRISGIRISLPLKVPFHF